MSVDLKLFWQPQHRLAMIRLCFFGSCWQIVSRQLFLRVTIFTANSYFITQLWIDFSSNFSAICWTATRRAAARLHYGQDIKQEK